MTSGDNFRDLTGAELFDNNGEKVGKIGQLYLDDYTGEPKWATVNTGFFGTNESFVPLALAQHAGNGVRVPYEKSTIKDAPNVLVGRGRLDESQERELYVYYGLDHAGQRSDSDQADGDINLTEGQRNSGRR